MITNLGKSNSYRFDYDNGTMVQNECVHISKGTKIFAYGYAMSLQYFVVYNDNMDAVEIGSPEDVEEVPENYFGARHHLDPETRPISQKFGIGFYYDESGEVISDEVINKSLARAEKIDRLTEEKKEREARQAEETREQLLKDYSFLERANRFDHKTCGSNIRTELKRAFPGVKFSVRYESFSGGNSYNIAWTDGATVEQVEKITNKYSYMHPDAYSYGDYWDCVPSIFNDLFGSVGYVCVNRNFSDEAINKVIAENPTFDRAEACDLLWKMDLTPVIEKKAEKAKKEVISGDFSIIDYSAKAFAVIGDTKPIKDDLKRLGGKFNARLSCGAGWIFSNSKREEVELLLYK